MVVLEFLNKLITICLSKGNNSSTFSELKKIAKAARLKSSSQDFVNLFDSVCVGLNVDDLSLMSELARRVKFPFLDYFDELTLCPQNELEQKFNFVRFSVKSDKIICLDPGKLPSHVLETYKNKIYLTTPALISKSVKKINENILKTGQDVFKAILSEAIKLRASSATIKNFDKFSEYQLVLPTNQIAVGRIDQDGALFVNTFLKSIPEVYLSDSVKVLIEFNGNETINIKYKTIENSIWLVEDDYTFQRVIYNKLIEKGLSVRAFNSPKEFTSALLVTNFIPSVAIIDFHLPGHSGDQLIKWINDNPDYQKISCILLTSSDLSSCQIESINAGARVCIQKQSDPQILFAYLDRLLLNS